MTAWLVWSITITRWKLWALKRVRNIEKLKKNAVEENLMWYDGTVFAKTAFHFKGEKALLKLLESRKTLKLEICTPNYQSAKNAFKADAHRIELCEQLNIGGVTPSYKLIEKVKDNLDIETFVLVRPRGGNFVYTDQEFETMKSDIEFCKEQGCDGIVSGVLKSDKTIDLVRTKALVELARPLAFTFHRAFDEVVKPQEALEQLIEIGVERILTSGQKPTAEEGLKLLNELHQKAQNRITILAGAGINAKNAVKFKDIGLLEIHASASKYIDSVKVSDVSMIKGILDAIC